MKQILYALVLSGAFTGAVRGMEEVHVQDQVKDVKKKMTRADVKKIRKSYDATQASTKETFPRRLPLYADPLDTNEISLACVEQNEGVEQEDDGIAYPDKWFGCCPGLVKVSKTEVEVTKSHFKKQVVGVNIETEKQAQVNKALFYAVLKKNPVNVLFALSCGADVNAKDGIGWAPIHYAARDRSTEVATVLLAVPGVDVGSITGNGRSLLQLIHSRRDNATPEQQEKCDMMIGYLVMIYDGTYPYKVRDNMLIDVTRGMVVLNGILHD